MSGVHLFAGDQLAEGHRYPGGFVAVCGTVVRPCGVSRESGAEDPGYCAECVAAAVGWSAGAGDRVPEDAECVVTR